MNIEELSKSQLLLLTILVNFVVSIATGILTVSLLDAAPPVVTQTVDRIVENTVQNVAAASPAVQTITKTVTVPSPSEQDLTVAALSADAARVVSLYGVKDGTTTPAIAIGTYLPESKAIATATLDALPQNVVIQFADGSTALASISHTGGGVTIYGFADSATLPKATAPTLLAASSLALGQTVLALTADESAATGIVSHVAASGDIETSLPDIGTGSAAVDLSGNLVGIASGASAGDLISANQIYALLTATSSTATASSTTPGT